MINFEETRVKDKFILNTKQDKILARTPIIYGSGGSNKFLKKYKKTTYGEHHGKMVIVMAKDVEWKELVIRFEVDSKDTYFISGPRWFNYPKKRTK